MPATCLRNFTVRDLNALDYKLCCFALWNFAVLHVRMTLT